MNNIVITMSNGNFFKFIKKIDGISTENLTVQQVSELIFNTEKEFISVESGECNAIIVLKYISSIEVY